LIYNYRLLEHLNSNYHRRILWRQKTIHWYGG